MKLIKLTALVVAVSGCAAFGAEQTPQQKVSQALKDTIWSIHNHERSDRFVWHGFETVEHAQLLKKLEDVTSDARKELAEKLSKEFAEQLALANGLKGAIKDSSKDQKEGEGDSAPGQ